MIDKIVDLLNGWLRLVRAVESLLVDAIAATAPWLAPVVPAYMVWQAMINKLGFTPVVAWVSALVVEFLGLSAITTTFQFWDWNDSKRERDPKAPIAVAILAAGFYMAVVLTVNVILDNASDLHKLAKALLSSLSVIAAVILALRSQHARRLAAREQEKAERKMQRQAVKSGRTLAGNFPKVAGGERNLSGISSGYTISRVDWRNLPREDQMAIREMSTAQIVAYYGCTDRVARNWREYSRRLASDNGHDGDFQGF